MEWRSVALGHFDRLLAEDHTQQADQCDERRGRRPDMDKPVSRPNGETHDEGDEIADHDRLTSPAAAAQCGQPRPPRPCDRPPARRRARRSLRWARRDNLRRRIPERVSSRTCADAARSRLSVATPNRRLSLWWKSARSKVTSRYPVAAIRPVCRARRGT
jgi:hypothetical protein